MHAWHVAGYVKPLGRGIRQCNEIAKFADLSGREKPNLLVTFAHLKPLLTVLGKLCCGYFANSRCAKFFLRD